MCFAFVRHKIICDHTCWKSDYFKSQHQRGVFLPPFYLSFIFLCSAAEAEELILILILIPGVGDGADPGERSSMQLPSGNGLTDSLHILVTSTQGAGFEEPA